MHRGRGERGPVYSRLGDLAPNTLSRLALYIPPSEPRYPNPRTYVPAFRFRDTHILIPLSVHFSVSRQLASATENPGYLTPSPATHTRMGQRTRSHHSVLPFVGGDHHASHPPGISKLNKLCCSLSVDNAARPYVARGTSAYPHVFFRRFHPISGDARCPPSIRSGQGHWVSQ
jgi:hypothetical protein